jgi:hypothetical protein
MHFSSTALRRVSHAKSSGVADEYSAPNVDNLIDKLHYKKPNQLNVTEFTTQNYLATEIRENDSKRHR